MADEQDDIMQEARQPKPIFLVLASLAAAGAVAAYLYQDTIVETSGITTFAFLLLMLVLIAMGFMLCYRVPQIGNRLLGYGVIISPKDKTVNEGYHYTGTFKVETAVDTKRQNSKRKQSRYNRRKIAALTREMQKDGLINADNSTDEADIEPESKTASEAKADEQQ
ncbi:hypothetical protein [Kordiimonas sp. SCSIO 12610]|uniref:hypothetical protein n=1 Tax=Kordiimonas sp. SCSIO 12610 TaxID=2829597 RepID=UPI00210C8A0D|nr:hypothetical protein [Kordiimonas sp. SCSIO 12610]UTW54294.1 hypothetical protein KFF44_10745 [Kordiimonas sp. SCSIO 12610]